MHASLSEIWGEPIHEALLPSIDRFHAAVKKFPDNIALVCAHQPPVLYGIPSEPSFQPESDSTKNAEYLRWTYRSLQDGVNRLATGLYARGVRPGTAIITLLPNCAEFCLTWWAAMQLGAVMAPLDSRRLSNQEEISHMLSTIMYETGSKHPVLLAQDRSLLEHASFSAMEPMARILVATPGEFQSSDGNDTIFATLMDETSEDIEEQFNNSGEPEAGVTGHQDSSIVFTSGSTSLPKGVRRCYPLQTIATTATFDDPAFGTSPGDLWCAVAPNNHTVGTATLISPMTLGAGVVYASNSFSAESTADILQRERCTHTLLIPTMVKLIADVMREQGLGKTHLKAAMIAASPPTKDTLHDIFEILGARGVCVRYGSTEGVACTSKIGRSVDEVINSDGRISVGHPARGTGVKICEPDAEGSSRLALRRGVRGEIHFSAPFSLPSLYIGQDDKANTCYQDENGKRWFVTGDQGLIDDTGDLFVVGRYKDLIIRGGENISPLAMELCLANNPQLGAITMQIVGQPDDVAGESPVVIMNGAFEANKFRKEIHQTIAVSMGLMWVPQEVIHLKDLELQDWPRTPLGKISKLRLRELVLQRHHAQQKAAHLRLAPGLAGDDHERWPKQVLSIWAHALGVTEADVSLDTPVVEFADSLTVARVRGQMRREIPKQEKLTARDMTENETIAKQMDLVLRGFQGRKDSLVDQDDSDGAQGPPDASRMIHLITQVDRFSSTKELVLESITKDGFGWDDVIDVFPAQAFVSELSREGVMDSAKFQNAFTTKATDFETLRGAFERMLRNNSILASYLVWDKHAHHGLDSDLALHVTLKHDNKLFDHVIQDGGDVDSADELRRIATAHPHPEWVLAPNILFRVLIYRIKETGHLGFIYSVSHSVMDATHQARFLGDLSDALSLPVPQSLRPHTSYKLWAESFYSLKSTLQARASVAWHAEYLKDIQKYLPEAQWPIVPLPRPTFDPTGKDYEPGAKHSFTVPDLAVLRKEHPDISAPIIVKAALALFNARRTETKSAVFSNVQAGRTEWPFFPNSLTESGLLSQFDEATDVAGPLLQAVTNFIKFDRTESVINFLRRLQADQQDLTRHAHAPWADIEKALDRSSGTAEHEGLMRKVFTMQIFNWIPGMGAQAAGVREPFENIKALASVTRWQVGVIVRAGLGGANNDTVYLALLGDGLKADEMNAMTAELETNVRWLTHPDHWSRSCDL